MEKISIENLVENLTKKAKYTYSIGNYNDCLNAQYKTCIIIRSEHKGDDYDIWNTYLVQGETITDIGIASYVKYTGMGNTCRDGITFSEYIEKNNIKNFDYFVTVNDISWDGGEWQTNIIIYENPNANEDDGTIETAIEAADNNKDKKLNETIKQKNVSKGKFKIREIEFKDSQYNEIICTNKIKLNCDSINPNELCLSDNNNLFISEYFGNLLLYNSDIKKIVKISNIKYDGIPLDKFSGLCVNPDNKDICAVIDGGSNVVLWDSKNDKILKFPMKNDGKITSIAFSPEGDYLLVGRGLYSLSTNFYFEKALIELWSLKKSEPEFVYSVGLAGTSVDSINWTDYNEIICTTGMDSQQFGFIIVLDSELRTKTYIQTPFVMGRNAKFDNFEKKFYIIKSDSIYEAYINYDQYICDGEYNPFYRKFIFEENIKDFSYLEPNNLILSNGLILNINKEKITNKLKFYGNCISTAIDKKNEICYGIDNNGSVYDWLLKDI